MSKRSRDPKDDPRSGPSKNQLRGLAYTGKKPAFLQNALTALAGGGGGAATRTKPELGPDGRPAIPTRPEGEEEEESEEDEWDFGRGDEAPSVVVLKEGKHLERDEVERLRAQGKADGGVDPLLSASAVEQSSTSKGSLSFSSGTSSKSKPKAAGENETWDDVVKRSKSEAESKQKEKEQREAESLKQKEKDEKKKKKEKKEAKKKIAKLSFSED